MHPYGLEDNQIIENNLRLLPKQQRACKICKALHRRCRLEKSREIVKEVWRTRSYFN